MVFNLTASKYWDIGENYLNWIYLRLNSRLSQKQDEFIDAFTVVHQSSYCQSSPGSYEQSQVHNFRLLSCKEILGFGLTQRFLRLVHMQALYWRVMPSSHVTEYNTLRDNVLHKYTQHWSIDWNPAEAACLERYVQHKPLFACDAIIVSAISWMLHAVAAVVIIILNARWWSWARLCCVWKLLNLS